MISELLDKEAALFVQAEQCQMQLQFAPIQKEIITEVRACLHLRRRGYAALSGCSVALVPGKLVIMNPEDVDKAIRKSDGSLGHFPNGSLVCVENTSNRGGGTCYSQENLDAIAKVAHENDCAVHMDGARLFNAAIATGTNPARIVRFTTILFVCLRS